MVDGMRSPHTALMQDRRDDVGRDATGHGIVRSDLVLFLLYCALYAGFVVLAAFGQHFMATPVVGGVNLAIAYGMGLILAAVGLAGLATLLRRGGAK
jgi:hypothetical protein